MTAFSTVKTLSQLAEYVDPGLDTTYSTHGLHPYPAKFIPQIPSNIIQQHTNERHVVFDPFCGSGTTLLEALLCGRRSIGCDSNPIGALISRAKTTPISPDSLAEADLLIDVLNEADPIHLPKCAAPDDPRLDHWFTPQMTAELAYVRYLVSNVKHAALRQLGTCVFSSIIVSVSNQESDTRYAAIEKILLPGNAIRKFISKFRKALISIQTVNQACRHNYLPPEVFCEDIRLIDGRKIRDNSVDLVVTSPPYANSFDYYLYHKWRMIWLGFDHAHVRRSEIGSRYEHSSQKAPLHVFESKMAEALQRVSCVLKPSKLAYFLVGDSVLSGELIDSEASLRRSAQGSGLKFVDTISYPLAKVSRSFREKTASSCHGGAKNGEKLQRVLVFESINSGAKSAARTAISSRAKPSQNEVELRGIVKSGARLALKSSDTDRHVHSLARYPSKFVPAIPRWAIETFSKPGDIVFDPFSGSGTTSVEAVILGRHALAADVSPFACLATRAKTTRVTEPKLRQAASQLLDWLNSADCKPITGARFERDDFWFNLTHLDEFEAVRKFIVEKLPPNLHDFFLVALAATIRKFGFQDEAQIKVKRDQKKVVSGTPSPLALMNNGLPKQVERLCSFIKLADSDVQSRVFQHSADQPFGELANVDLLVTSPPYINAMNYPMTHRYENILLGLLDTERQKEHDREYIGTERVSATEYNTSREVPRTWSTSAELNGILAKIYASEPKRSYICYSYFTAMNRMISIWADSMKTGSKIVLVCGKNRIRGVPVDTVGILQSFLRDYGFADVTSFEYEIVKQSLRITRHSTSDLINFDGVVVMEKNGG